MRTRNRRSTTPRRASVAVPARPQPVVVRAAVGVTADRRLAPVMRGVAQAVVAGVAHLHEAMLAALLRNRGGAEVRARPVIISGGGDDSADSRQGPEDRHVTMLLL